MNIEKVNPVVNDGVEFYVSSDGTETGMSISGLARFVGVDRSSIQALIDKMQSEDRTLSKSLEPFVDNIFSLRTEGSNGAKIMPSRTCEALIFYYAYESNRITEEVRKTARVSHRKFAQVGLDSFIKNIAGYAEQQADNLILRELKFFREELKEVKEFASELKVIRNTTTTYFPGCNTLLDEIIDNQALLLPCENGALSLEGWLYQKGVTLTPTKFRKLAHIVAATFKSMVKRDPDKQHFKLANGKTKYNVYVYEPQHHPILQVAFNKVLEDS